MDPTIALTTTFVAALADLGLRHAIVSPGSRNTPLSLAFVAEPRVATHVIHDERSAAFVALGTGAESGLPAAVVTTSGTAAAHLLPAIVEARHGRVPLLALTADRPPELRGAGAPQTVDQLGLFGDNVRLFHEMGIPDAATARTAASVALRVWDAAMDPPGGPVHVNFPFREPLALPTEPAPSPGVRYAAGYRLPEPESVDRLAAALSGRKAIVVVGGRTRPGFAAAAAMVAADARIPILADIQSRFGSPATIAFPDLVVSRGIPRSLMPDVVLRVGGLPTAKALWRWLETAGVPQVFLDDGAWREPLATARMAVRGDPAATLIHLVGRLAPAPDGWLERWVATDREVAERIDHALASEPFPNEPMIARTVMASLPPEAVLYVGSSMPVRDADTFGGVPRPDVTVLANRGANGIDGLISSAAGAAISSERPVVVLAGDLSVLHDATALGILARGGLPVTIVAVDNDGGGIFHFLPQARALDAERFERLFGTPHGTDLTAVAGAFGVPARTVTERDELGDLVGTPSAGPRLIRIPTDRTTNAAVHARLREGAG